MWLGTPKHCEFPTDEAGDRTPESKTPWSEMPGQRPTANNSTISLGSEAQRECVNGRTFERLSVCAFERLRKDMLLESLSTVDRIAACSSLHDDRSSCQCCRRTLQVSCMPPLGWVQASEVVYRMTALYAPRQPELSECMLHPVGRTEISRHSPRPPSR